MSGLKMETNRVTVLIPTFNRSEFLLECLESVLAQTRPAHEVIVIDDGSTDDTLELLAAYEGRVRVLSKSNGGKSTALNLGMKHVTGDLVWIFDDDDVASPAALETLVGLLKHNPDADFAYGRHRRFKIVASGELQWIETGYWTNCESDEFLVATLDDMFAHQQGMIVRKDLFERIGPFDETLVRSQDYEMLIRIARVGTCVATEDIVFHQRVHDGVRGTREKHIQAEKRDLSWSQSDRMIFQKFYSKIELQEYLVTGQSISEPAHRRHALLRRASIMARKKLWGLAINDLREAERTSHKPLSEHETNVLRSAFASKYGCDEILSNSPLIDELCEIPKLSQTGSQIVAAMARGLRWKVRSELLALKCWKSVKFFLIMNKLKKAASMPTISASSDPISCRIRLQNKSRSR
ncbi:glycosyltransferase [Hyphomonas sp.]|uniref:glycosyltransferase n=1 Tax=Hyphomonas sp. TaxID=87 RepID=UPI003565C441